MKFTVDLELCVGCGACEATCQEVFELVDDKSQVKLDPVPEEFQEGALKQKKIALFRLFHTNSRR